jgi:chemotaxis signal transduction protein
MKEPYNNSAEATRPGTDEMLLLYAGGKVFAVRAAEAEAPGEWSEPVPLPHAPAAVLGVVSVHGRIYTLLDTRALLDAQAHAHEDVHEDVREGAPGFIVALRGDEQLALAAERIEGPLEINAAALDPPDIPFAPLLRATLERNGTCIHVLDPSALFDAAMQGTERRRRRT